MQLSFTRVIRILLLAVVITAVYAFDFVTFRLNASLDSILWLLVTGLLQALVLSYVLARSVWHGWKLIATLFVVYAGITVLQTNIEAIVFLQYFVSIIPVDTMPQLILNGLIGSALVAIAAVLILDKMRPAPVPVGYTDHLKMSAFGWVWKLSALAVIYLFIYFLFGLVVAKPLAGPAFDEYYGDLQLPLWILPFQLVRGLIWALLTVPIIKMMNGSRWEITLGVALLLSVLISSLVIPPNEFMPAPIRLAHFVELFSSMFVFGLADAWILTFHRQHTTQHDKKIVPHPA